MKIRIEESFPVNLSEGQFSSSDSGRLELNVTLIRAGQSMNGVNYAREVLVAALPLVQGMPAFANHNLDPEAKRGPVERNLEKKVGYYRNPYMDGDEMKATLRIFPHHRWCYNLLKEQAENPDAQIAGISIEAFGEGYKFTEQGREFSQVEKIVNLMSGDVVDIASAGGHPNHILESLQRQPFEFGGEETMKMTLEQLEKDYPELSRKVEAKVMKSVQEEMLSKDEAIRKLEEKVKELEGAAAGSEASASEGESEDTGTEGTENESDGAESALTKEFTDLKDRVAKLEKEKTALEGSLKKKEEDELLNVAVVKKLEPLRESLLPQSRKRVVEGLLRLGSEKTEKEAKKSNWDIRIQEELDYVAAVGKVAEGSDDILNSARGASATGEMDVIHTRESLSKERVLQDRIDRISSCF